MFREWGALGFRSGEGQQGQIWATFDLQLGHSQGAIIAKSLLSPLYVVSTYGVWHYIDMANVLAPNSHQGAINTQSANGFNIFHFPVHEIVC